MRIKIESRLAGGIIIALLLGLVGYGFFMKVPWFREWRSSRLEARALELVRGLEGYESDSQTYDRIARMAHREVFKRRTSGVKHRRRALVTFRANWTSYERDLVAEMIKQAQEQGCSKLARVLKAYQDQE